MADNKENCENKKVKKRMRKTPREIENAVSEVVTQGQSIRSVSKSSGIAKSMLARLVKKAKEAGDTFTYHPNIGNRKVFSDHEEKLLEEYLTMASKMAHGLTRTQVRVLAFQYVSKLKKECPDSWNENEMAGVDWYNGFMKRRRALSLRKPEKTSLARSTAFNKTTVGNFFNNLERVFKKYKFSSENIYNADETGLLTVTDLPNVVAQKGVKQVSQVCSQERGQLVTMLAFISASGNTIPPAFVFPRVHFKSFMIEECPVGSLGLAYQSGWMTAENFFHAFQHFVKYAKPTEEKPVLLLMDNHESHISINVATYAKENNVIILTFPPHCSHRLQPLDLSVFGPFKTFYKSALNDWMVSNPGRTATIYTLPKLAKLAYEKAFSLKNIIAGFQKAGISPYNSSIFSEEDFLGASVTEQSLEEPIASGSGLTAPDKVPETLVNHSEENNQSVIVYEQQEIITPETVRPFPKAGKRQHKNKGRKKGASKVITDTPEISILKALNEEKENKRKRSLMRQEKKVKKRVLQESSSSISSSEDSHNIEFNDSESGDDFSLDNDGFEFDQNVLIQQNDFVIIKFGTKEKNTFRHAVGQILEMLEGNEFKIKFLKKSNKTDKFKYPDEDDISDVNKNDIVMLLPKPQRMKGSQRVQEFYSFPVDLSNIVGLM